MVVKVPVYVMIPELFFMSVGKKSGKCSLSLCVLVLGMPEFVAGYGRIDKEQATSLCALTASQFNND